MLIYRKGFVHGTKLHSPFFFNHFCFIPTEMQMLKDQQPMLESQSI